MHNTLVSYDMGCFGNIGTELANQIQVKNEFYNKYGMINESELYATNLPQFIEQTTVLTH